MTDDWSDKQRNLLVIEPLNEDCHRHLPLAGLDTATAGTWSSKVHLPFVFIRRNKMVSTVNIGAAQQLLGNRKAGTSPNHLQMSSPPSIIINPD